jgi:hypothetical protein
LPQFLKKEVLMRFCHHDRFATLADIVGYYDGITKP